MFAKIAERITEELEDNQIIKSEDRELYVYGFNQGITILLNLITTLCIGLLFGCVVELLVFMAAYIPLRSFAGGYHAKTPLRCYLSSIVMLIIVSVAIQYVTLEIWIHYVIVAVSAIVIAVLAPVEDRNKPLDEIEMKVYKQRTIFIVIIEIAVFVILDFLKLELVYDSISYGLIFTGIVLLLGKHKNITIRQ